MSGRRRLAWVLFFVWAVWLYAVQGMGSEVLGVGAWTPELGLALLLAFDARLSRRGARAAACLVACARIVFSTDPPLAILAGFLAVVAVSGTLRSVLDVDRPLFRGALAVLYFLFLSSFWSLSWRAALAADGAHAPPLEPAWRTALATGAAACFAGALLRLPGLRQLRRRRL